MTGDGRFVGGQVFAGFEVGEGNAVVVGLVFVRDAEAIMDGGQPGFEGNDADGGAVTGFKGVIFKDEDLLRAVGGALVAEVFVFDMLDEDVFLGLVEDFVTAKAGPSGHRLAGVPTGGSAAGADPREEWAEVHNNGIAIGIVNAPERVMDLVGGIIERQIGVGQRDDLGRGSEGDAGQDEDVEGCCSHVIHRVERFCWGGAQNWRTREAKEAKTMTAENRCLYFAQRKREVLVGRGDFDDDELLDAIGDLKRRFALPVRVISSFPLFQGVSDGVSWAE